MQEMVEMKCPRQINNGLIRQLTFLWNSSRMTRIFWPKASSHRSLGHRPRKLSAPPVLWLKAIFTRTEK